MEYYLKLDHIGLQYHKKYPLITDFSLSLNKGEIGCLLGASGCGKTTILNAIAGFHPVNHGSIFINQQCVSSTDFSLPVEQRHVGMVFQQHNLFPHLNVTRNILFGLRHTDRQEQHNRLEFLLALIRLSDLKDKYPHQLSGGQQQRVALARALAPRPDILLLDEPFASQDTELRENLAGEIRDILKYEHTTALLVTHNQLEAFSMADRIGIIHEGTLQQWDSGYQIYHEPANRFVANFIGQASFIRGEVIAHDQVKTCLGLLQGSLPQDIRTGQKVDVLMRPDDLEHDDLSPLKAHIINKRFRGVNFLYTLSLDNGEILHCYVPSHHNHAIGEKLGITITLDHLIVFT